ncbi:HNH endonuclease [Bacillus manliponensis]|uniref:HNH endonuclease n=1 Tax=Bacillus manliponensis TaxID=574376 RepID=UPI00068A0B12|nr:HNH endonuclease [Bacillus manliponensis]
MNKKFLYRISEILVAYAKRGELIEYGQLSKEIGGAVSPVQLNKPLGVISEMCIERNMPPLSAIVINRNSQMPGEGFFTYIAPLMGYTNLKGSEWDNFYYEQRDKAFEYGNWDALLSGFHETVRQARSNNTWIFQGNPLYFRINDYIEENEQWFWSLNQEHYKDVLREGDTVYIWRSDGGQKGTGGVIAKGKVTWNIKQTSHGAVYWIDEDRTDEKEMIPINREQVLKQSSIARMELAEHPVLHNLLILRMANQTNYLLSSEHGEALDRLWAEKIEGETFVFNEKQFIRSVREKEYERKDNTQYYILTAKCSGDEGELEYRIMLLEDGKVVCKKRLRSSLKKQLLTKAKRRGLKLLFEHNPSVSIQEVSMVHYKQNRPKASLWELENQEIFKKMFSTIQKQCRDKIVEEDITSELAQEDSFYTEGAATVYYGTRYERDVRNRSMAIEIHGCSCVVCGFDFEKVYGERGKGFIEVHHVKPLSMLESVVEINPKEDLVPVCSNCHRMIHRKKDEILTVEELRAIIQS